MPWAALAEKIAAPMVVALFVGVPSFVLTLDRLNEQSLDQDEALDQIRVELGRVRDATDAAIRTNDTLAFTVSAVQRTLDEVTRRANEAASQEDLDDLEQRLETFMDQVAPRRPQREP